MSIDGIVISSLLGIVVALLGVIYRGVTNRLSRLEANFYNFTRSNFVLLGRLHPSSGNVIAEAMAEFYTKDMQRSNGVAKTAN